MLPLCACLFLLGQASDDWQRLESVHLKNTRQVTRDYVRAGEGYFSPDGKKIIFQAEERGVNPFYQMFVMDLDTGAARRVSPGAGKTTCGYFHPAGTKIIFASSHLDPEATKHYAVEQKLRDEEKASKKRRRYVWDFDAHMDIFELALADVAAVASAPLISDRSARFPRFFPRLRLARSSGPACEVPMSGNEPARSGAQLKRLTDAKGYDAEGSYSADGKQIVFCSNRSGEKNLELYIMDADGKNVRQLTKAPGCYNGGPFFSPDGKKVIFRSDRKKKDHLQLFVINADGSGEKALTDDDNWVFWAPYWYKDNLHILYTAADHSNPLVRPNYDLYWMNIETGKKVRLTYAPGADVLPVFSPDYTKVMWTSNRDGRSPTQLYLADFVVPR